jgi:hypothetical protein
MYCIAPMDWPNEAKLPGSSDGKNSRVQPNPAWGRNAYRAPVEARPGSKSCTLRTNAVANWIAASAFRNYRKRKLLFSRERSVTSLSWFCQAFNPGTSRRVSGGKLQVERVQFPADAIETEEQLDALVLDRETARANKVGVAEFRPVDLARLSAVDSR